MAVGLLVTASPLLVPLGLGGVVIAQLAFLGGVPVLTAIVRRANLLRALGLRRPTARALAGGTLIGASFWCISMWVLVPLVDADERELEALEELFFGDQVSIWLLLIAIAVVPAVCEEILVRGVVARSLRQRLGMVSAIALSGLLFGLMHMSLARLLPTAALGMVLAYVTLASGSVVPAMVAHGLNNAIVLLAGSRQIPRLLDWVEGRPAAWGLGATGICAIGVALMWGSERRPGPD